MATSKTRKRAEPLPTTLLDPDWSDKLRKLRTILQTKSSEWMIGIMEREEGAEAAGWVMFLLTTWEAMNRGATLADAQMRAEKAGQKVESSAVVKAAWLAAAATARRDPDGFQELLASVGEAPTDGPAPTSVSEVAS